MAEEITKASDFKKIFIKHGIEEEPVIVIQRFLNIFKQLHIFNEQQTADFNKMILDFPAELRGLFRTLPGGSLLQEYVDDLEEQTGNIRDRSSTVNVKMTAGDDENGGEGGSSGEFAGGGFGGGGKVVADASFVKEMTKAFVQAIRYNAKTKKDDDHILVDDTVKAQSELLKVQSKEISNIIARALQESQAMSMKSIVNAMQAFQKENMNVLAQMMNGRPTPNAPARPPVYDYYTPSFGGEEEKQPLNVVDSDDEWDYVEVSDEELSNLDKSLFGFEEEKAEKQAAVKLSIMPVKEKPAEEVKSAAPVVKPEEQSVKPADDFDFDFDFDELDNLDLSQDDAPVPEVEPKPQPVKAVVEEVSKVEPAPAAPQPKPEPVIAPVSEPVKDIPESAEAVPDSKRDDDEWELIEIDNNPKDASEWQDAFVIKTPERDVLEEGEVQEVDDAEEFESDVDDEQSSTEEDIIAENAHEDDDNDWEWEYEEVDEEGNPISHAAGESEEGGDDDNDWEWEYEEVDEEEGSEDDDGRFIPSQPINGSFNKKRASITEDDMAFDKKAQ